MSVNLQIFLEKSEENLRQAIENENNDLKKAKEYYLLAARYLLEAAKLSKGDMKKIRKERAEKILARADALRFPEHRRDMLSISNDEAPEKSDEWLLQEIPSISFSDVAGLENVKKQIKSMLIYPYLYPDVAKEYGIDPGGGLLLYGPPGTGKTYIAKATAHEIDALFFSIKPSDIMSQWVGVAEKNISKLFEAARKCEKAVIFIDEIDALLPKRHSNYSTVMKRVVPQILAEMDGLSSKNEGILFMGATNEPWDIDEAALRPGRFDKKIYVPPPDAYARKRLFELNLRKTGEDIDIEKLVSMTEGYTGADIVEICKEASQRAYMEYVERGVKRPVRMKDIAEIIGEVPPSVSKKMIDLYERFARGKIEQ